MWELFYDEDGINFETEVLALAHQFKSIHKLLSKRMKQYREVQAQFVERVGLDIKGSFCGLHPEAVPVALRGLARTIVVERSMGITRGHKEALDHVERELSAFDAKDRKKDRVAG